MEFFEDESGTLLTSVTYPHRIMLNPHKIMLNPHKIMLNLGMKNTIRISPENQADIYPYIRRDTKRV